MRIRDAQAEGEEPFNLVPLMDMAFNLLIFFMAATSFTQIERDLNVHLPRTAAFQTLSSAPRQLVINIRADGSMVVDGSVCDATALDQRITAASKEQPQRIVLVRADRQSIVEHFGRVAADCYRHGLKTVTFAVTEQQSGH